MLPGMLPIMLPQAGHAAEVELATVTLQYSRVEQDRQALTTAPNDLPVFRADTLRWSASGQITDVLQFSLALSQDTWSGATAVASAPFAANTNRPVLRNTPSGVVQSGASPYLNSTVLLDAERHPVILNSSGQYQRDDRNELVMSSASPELRNQLDLALGHTRGEQEYSMALSLSDEPDFVSRAFTAGISHSFNQQLSTVNFQGGYSSSDIRARLDSDALPYLSRTAYAGMLTRDDTTEILRASQHTVNMQAGLTQVINANTWLDAGLHYTQQQGYLEVPYKSSVVVFVPLQPTSAGGILPGDVRALLEQRPDSRYLTGLSLHYAQHLPVSDGALHLQYQYNRDNWQVDSHTLEASYIQPVGSWTFSPYVRYYAQQAAGFYQPVLYSEQAFRRIATNPAGLQLWQTAGDSPELFSRTSSGDFLDAAGQRVDAALLDLQPLLENYSPALLPEHFTSDQRLAGFGSLSAGVSVRHQFAGGLALEAGFDYYSRRGRWQVGNGEDSGFADMQSRQINVGLALDFGEASRPRSAAVMTHEQHTAMQDMKMDMEMDMMGMPAGLRLQHSSHGAGSSHIAWQTTSLRQAGSLLRNGDVVADAVIVADGCAPADPCRFAPAQMDMQMHMLMLMRGITDRLSVMLMPQYMSMDMVLRELDGRPPTQPGEHVHGSAGHHTGTLGDTLLSATYSYPLKPNQQVMFTLGLSIPTGKTDLAFRRQNRVDGSLVHFDMQTGSGTWDLQPAMSWISSVGAGQYGVQLSGISRAGQLNDQGYRLGAQWQGSVWTTQALTPWLGFTARLTETVRHRITGNIPSVNDPQGPMDYPQNQGGQYRDLGVGFTVRLPANNQLSVEWEQPLQDSPNGIQLARQGQWSLAWQTGF